MEKEYLIKKYSDQKGNKEYSFYRTLNEENNKITLDSFNQFRDIEADDKNLAFFVSDEVIFLSYSNARKFFKTYLKTYRDLVNNGKLFRVYIDIKNSDLLAKLGDEGLCAFNTTILESKKDKTK